MRPNSATPLLLLLLLLVPATACKRGEASGPPKPARLEKLNLQINLPPGSKIKDDAAGGEAVSITGKQIGEVRVEAVKTPATIDQVTTPTAVVPRHLRLKNLPDGFAVDYDFAGTLDPTYTVEVHRTIGGRSIRCWSNTGGKDWQTAALAACTSLRP